VAEPETATMAMKWKAASLRWASEVKLAYLSNPAAKRDFRVQFRGNRSWPLFGGLIGVMAVVALYLFWTITIKGQTPAEIQEDLLYFCAIIFAILGLAVSLISPALAAASVSAEKQSRSLDLVFSSPIKPSSYLIGKIAASYRLIWVFMALSLPFTAISTMMGGGTWWNVLESYFLLSLHGLLFAAVGVYFASLVQKTITAMFYTYVTVGAYLAAMATIGFPYWTMHQMPTPFAGGLQNPLTSLVPFFVEYASGTYFTVLGVAVPNILIATGITGVAVKLIVDCAGALLSPLRDRERSVLRVKMAGVLAAVSACAGYATIDPAVSAWHAPSLGLLLPTIPLLIVLPYLACYGSDGERRQVHAKLFSIRDLFGRSVAGALPYLYSLLVASGLGSFVGRLVAHQGIGQSSWISLLYSFAFWTFAWATARFASSFNNGVKTSRALQFLTLAGVIGVPLPVFVAYSATFVDPILTHNFWKWFILAPFIGQYEAAPALLLSIGIFISGVGLSLWSEGNYRRRRDKKKLEQMAGESVLSPTANLNVTPSDTSPSPQLVQGA
jgi:hypothetical protein